MERIIKAEEDGKLLRDILKNEIGLSNAFIKHLKFVEGGILLNGEPATVRRTVSEGDLLTLATEDTEHCPALTPTELDVSIIIEEPSFVVPNKLPNMPTHPSHLHHGDTLADAIAFRYSKTPFVFRPINRLDRDTSGAVLVARNRLSASRLSQSMRDGNIKKQYLAVVCGIPPTKDGCGRIETYMRRTEKSIIVRENCEKDQGGDYALTLFSIIKTTPDGKYSLVLASPITGRTHQIRVHFAGVGCPLVGDSLYGTDSFDGIGRQALHALTLEFPHPDSGVPIRVWAELQNDMNKLLRLLFGEDGEIFNTLENMKGDAVNG